MVILNIDVESAVNCIGNSCHILNGKKKTPVILNLQADNFSIKGAIDLYKKSSVIEAISYDGALSTLRGIPLEERDGVYIAYEYPLDIVNEQTIAEAVGSVPEGVTCVCRVPDDFNDMKLVYNMCSRYSNLRFAGGYLFRLEGCRLGVLSSDNIKSSQAKTTKYIATGDCNVFKTINFDSGMQLVATTSQATRSKSAKVKSSAPKQKSTGSSDKSKTSKSSAPKDKKPSAKQVMSGFLFSQGVSDL